MGAVLLGYFVVMSDPVEKDVFQSETESCFHNAALLTCGDVYKYHEYVYVSKARCTQ